MAGVILFTGRSALEFFSYLTSLMALFSEAVSSIFRHWDKTRSTSKDDITRQILFTGVEAIPLVSLLGVMIGCIVIIQSTTLAPKFGAGEFLGKIMVIGIIRELGPLVTTFIVIGRSGAALATYLGNMKVANELDALEVMGIDPIHVRVMPALVGSIISVFGLTLLFDAVAILGGHLISRLVTDLPLSAFLQIILNELSAVDIILIAIKSFIFGSVVGVVSCFHGMKIGYSFQEVPVATIKAVVNSIVLSVTLNTIVTWAFYANRISG